MSYRENKTSSRSNGSFTLYGSGTGTATGKETGNDGFLYYAIYCTHYTGNHCLLLCSSSSRTVYEPWINTHMGTFNTPLNLYHLWCVHTAQYETDKDRDTDNLTMNPKQMCVGVRQCSMNFYTILRHLFASVLWTQHWWVLHSVSWLAWTNWLDRHEVSTWIFYNSNGTTRYLPYPTTLTSQRIIATADGL